MDKLTQQLDGLGSEARSTLQEFFDVTRKYSSDVVNIATKIRAQSKPKVTATKKTSETKTAPPEMERSSLNATQANTIGSDTQELDPIRVARKSTVMEEGQEVPTPQRSPQDEDEAVEIQNTAAPKPKPKASNIGRELYSFDKDNGVKADPNLTVADAEALLDLMSGMEGQTVPNGENLLITSNGKKLFETDAEGKITYSINQRKASFDRSPMNNSLGQMQENLSTFIQAQRRVKPNIESGRKNEEGRSSSPSENLDRGIESADINEKGESNTPLERLDRAIKSGDIKQTNGVNPTAEQSQSEEQVATMLALQDRLKDGSVLTNGKSTITLKNQSRGISKIELTEPGQQPVSLGKVSKTGIVTLGSKYTAERTATVDNLMQNGRVEGLQQQQVSQAPAAPPSPTQSNDKAYGHQDLKRLNQYYSSPAYQQSDSAHKLTPRQANARLEQQKAQLLNAAQTQAEGKTFDNFNDDFFKDFRTDAVTFSDEEQADLWAANELEASQPERLQPLTKEADVKHQAPKLKP